MFLALVTICYDINYLRETKEQTKAPYNLNSYKVIICMFLVLSVFASS